MQYLRTNSILKQSERYTASDQLSVMDAYRINRLVKKLNELQEEYSELKKKIFAQHGTPGKEEGTVEISRKS